MTEDKNPFVKFQGMSERKTSVEIEADNHSELIRELVALIDCNAKINFDHHTTNIRHWESNNIEDRSAEELIDGLEKSIEDVKEGRTFTLEELREMEDDV